MLTRMRDKIRARQYVMTLHAEEEMDEDGLSIYDVESVILTGEIFEQQRDRKSRERKYLVRGQTVEGEQIAVVVSKFGPAGKLIILTIYAD
jgi:hypothetical protein